MPSFETSMDNVIAPRKGMDERLGILARCRAIPRVHLLWIAYLTLAAVLAVPLLLVEVPLSSDTLNHLARIHVLAHIDSDPDLARFFQPRDVLVPYMGLDWLLTPLARVVPTLVAGRIAIVLLLWGTVGAVVALQRVFTGRVGFEPLLMGLVSYNSVLAWGFLNYALGVIGALLGLAAWHGLRRRPWLLRLGVFSAVATAMYFTHLLALGLYGIMLGAYEVFGRPKAWRTPLRDWVVLAAQFIPAILLWLHLAMPSPGGQTGALWHPLLKVLGLISPFLFSGAMGEPSFGMAVFAVSVFQVYRLTRMGVLHWNRALAAPAATVLLLGFAVPTWTAGVFLGDMRLPVAAAFLAAAALSVMPGAAARLLPSGLLLALCIAVQTWSAGTALRACDRQYGELRAALQELPRGAILLPVQDDTPVSDGRCSRMRVYDHMAQLITVERSGYSPTFFSAATAMGVRDGLAQDWAVKYTNSFPSEALMPGGYLLWMHLGNHSHPAPPGLVLLHSGSFFDLFSIPGLPERAGHQG